MLGLPIIHLDKHYWKPNWVETSKAEWEAKVKELIKGDSWIMDGNYGSSLELRIPRADLIIFKDVSTLTCLYRITRRIIQYWGQVRPGITEGCVERFDIQFYHYVATYNLIRRKPLLKKLKSLSSDKEVIVIKENDEIEKVFKQKKS